MRWFYVGLILLFVCGCGSQNMQVIAENQSGQRLENVTVSGAGKSFEFGVLPDSGEAGYMTAEKLFGNRFPEKMTMSFATTEGKIIISEVAFERNAKPTRKLRVSIGSDMNTTGKFD